MWAIGALVGLIIGISIHPQIAIIGLLVGGLAGHAISRKTKGDSMPAILKRLAQLESEVHALRDEVRALQTPSSAEAGAAPVAVAEKIVEANAAPPMEMPIADAAGASPTSAAHENKSAPEMEPLPEPKLPGWLKRFWAGNPLAKVGIILLFFGVASGLRLAIDYGLLPVPLRLLFAAVAGIALIVFGVIKARSEERRNFGLAVQGGGFALLYLVGYFMLARYAMIGDGPAFFIFATLGIGCVFLAARQDGPVLAVFGLSGAFLAPVLAGGRTDSPLPLFSYFTLLNVLILTVDWFKSWRVLNIAGFILTFAVGMAWAVAGYRTEHYLVTQIFVALFLAAYAAMPAATSLLRAPGLSGWSDGLLLFGTPLIGAFLQTMLLEDNRDGLALSALIGSLWYFALWALLFRRTEPEIRLVERSHFGIALALLTIAIPLAFDAQVTSAFWAAEGAAVLWFGIRQQRVLSQGTGLAMQFIAGGALLLGWQHLNHRLPVANDAVLGAAILAVAALVSARMLRAASNDRPAAPGFCISPLLPFIWALLWWLGVGLDEIHRFASFMLHAPYSLLFVAVTTLCLEGIAVIWRWPQVRAAAVLLLGGLWISVIVALVRASHPFAGMMAIVLPLALVLHTSLLAVHERGGVAPFATLRHLGGWWLLLFSLALELGWQSRQHMPQPDFWSAISVMAVCASGIALSAWGAQRNIWPFAAPTGLYLSVGLLPPLVVLALTLVWANFHLSGTDGLGWPYVPFINVFDLVQFAGLGALWIGCGALATRHAPSRQILIKLTGALAFIWISALAARIAHHWGDIPFEIGKLMSATLFQALLTIFWTVIAIATMIHASRGGYRERWLGGIGLLGIVGAKLLLFDATGRGTLTWTATLIGVALLVLAASYFAPLPPKHSEEG